MSTYLNISDKIKLNSGPIPLLLNFYEGAAAAYSLRKLDGNYNGDAIVVTTNGSDSASIGFVNNELDTASLEAFAGSGDAYVATWYDQSENNLDAIQTTFSSMPKIVSNGSVILENSNPTVSFLGDYLETNIISPLISQPITTFSTYKANNNRFIYDNVSSSDVFRLNSTFPDFYPQISAGVSLTATSSSVSSFGLTTAIYNSANSFIYRNSIELVNGNTGSNSFEGLTIGANRNGLDNLSGFISEIILYSSNESANRTGIETNINNFYSIY